MPHFAWPVWFRALISISPRKWIAWPVKCLLRTAKWLKKEWDLDGALLALAAVVALCTVIGAVWSADALLGLVGLSLNAAVLSGMALAAAWAAAIYWWAWRPLSRRWRAGAEAQAEARYRELLKVATGALRVNPGPDQERCIGSLSAYLQSQEHQSPRLWHGRDRVEVACAWAELAYALTQIKTDPPGGPAALSPEQQQAQLDAAQMRIAELEQALADLLAEICED